MHVIVNKTLFTISNVLCNKDFEYFEHIRLQKPELFFLSHSSNLFKKQSAEIS